MKQTLKIVGSLCLLLALCLSIVACAKNSVDDNDDWITNDVEIDNDSPYAKPAKDNGDDGAATQSGERITLPTIPVK